MRADPTDYELVSPHSLQAAAVLLAKEPGEWAPIAGGTDLMVLYASGKLTAKRLVNIWNLEGLRQIEITPEELRVGAPCAYSDLRGHEVIAGEFPLLASAASWT